MTTIKSSTSYILYKDVIFLICKMSEMIPENRVTFPKWLFMSQHYDLKSVGAFQSSVG